MMRAHVTAFPAIAVGGRAPRGCLIRPVRECHNGALTDGADVPERLPVCMGYLFVAVIGVGLLVFLIVMLSRSRKNLPSGTLPSDHPVSVEKPAADAPTPSKATLPSAQQAENAQRRTPPA